MNQPANSVSQEALLDIPKVELHAHLEGTVPPSLIRRLAQRHKIQLPESLFRDAHTFAWLDFYDFLKAYDLASSVIRTREDYREITYDYLTSLAKEGGIYSEVFVSADHAYNNDLPYPELIEGIVEGIDQAEKDCGVVGRIILTCVRHFGVERSEEVARLAKRYPHPYVVGFGMGGDEAGFPPALFEKTYAIAAEAGLQATVHAGEMEGPVGIWEALKHLPVTRLGHGVRAVEDPHLVQEIIERGIVLEVCPTSNVALGVSESYQTHAWRALWEAGVRMTLNSDDPPYFGTSLGHEYATAMAQWDLRREDLWKITRTALEASFLEEPVKKRLFLQHGIDRFEEAVRAPLDPGE